MKSEFVPALILMDISIGAAALRLEFIQYHGKLPRHQPLHIKLGVDKSFKHYLSVHRIHGR